jgi:hypothetical protein
MTNPLDYTIQDADAMRYALMQDSSYRGGGAVRMEDGGFLKSLYKNVVPAHLRTFGETLMGDRTPITENNFTPSELDQMRNAVMSSRKDREITNARVFDNDVKKAFKSGASDKELMAIMKQGPSQKIDQSVGYQHYPGGDVEVRRDTDFGHDASIRSTLGRFAYNKDANGNLIVTDNYKFTNDLPRETRPTSDYAGMTTPEKLWLLAKDTAQMGGLETLPSRVGNAFIGADGRPVNVNLGAAPFAHGGAVHKADGGTVKPDPYFTQGQTPFAEYRHSIGMNHGGVRFDEGGEVSQDQMRYELANSPVMQATPRSPVQDFIGTAGGYMDKAGHFISEALEPIAESHPVHNFLANMILAAPLKSAGTALQDYTGTVRETDEENPVRGVISNDWRNLTTSRSPMLDPRVLDIAQFAAPVASGATKLLGAGAKAAAPFAKDVGAMANELYASGKMPLTVNPSFHMAEPVKAADNSKLTPFQIAHQNAQRNAALPIEQGGLGLPPDNTAMDRAKAMGFDIEAYHGTINPDITAFDPMSGKNARKGTGSWFSENPQLASTYAGNMGGTVMPVLIKDRKFAVVDAEGKNWARLTPDTAIYHSNRTDTPASDLINNLFHDYTTTNDIARFAKQKGDKGVRFFNIKDPGGRSRWVDEIPETADNLTVFDPTMVRGKFAAFDPFEKNSPDIMKANGGKVSFANSLDAMRHELTKAK